MEIHPSVKIPPLDENSPTWWKFVPERLKKIRVKFQFLLKMGLENIGSEFPQTNVISARCSRENFNRAKKGKRFQIAAGALGGNCNFSAAKSWWRPYLAGCHGTMVLVSLFASGRKCGGLSAASSILLSLSVFLHFFLILLFFLSLFSSKQSSTGYFGLLNPNLQSAARYLR